MAWFRERYPIVDVDGVRVLFQEDGKNVGWGLVRASNTGPVLVLRFEADSNARLGEIQALVEGRLEQIMTEVGAPPPPSPRTDGRARGRRVLAAA